MPYETSSEKLRQLMAKDSTNEIINHLYSTAHARAIEGFLARLQRGQLSKASIGQRTLAAVWSLLGEVYNGGFYQYFMNDHTSLHREVIPALERIGAVDVVPVIRRVWALFPGGRVPRNADDQCEILDEVPEEELEALDDEFYRIVGPYDDTLIERKMFAYICAHPEEFPELA